jgi:hypothetical protein
MPGQKVCWWHGGATPDSKLKEARRRAEAMGRELMVTYGTPIETDPADALLQEVYRTAGHIAWLSERITQTGETELAESWVMFTRVSGVSGSSAREMQELMQQQGLSGVWLELYMKERDRLIRVSQVAVAAGIEERRVKLAESMAAQMGAAMVGLVTDFGKDPNDPEVRALVFRRLTEASGTTPVSYGLPEALEPPEKPWNDSTGT